MRRSNSRPRSGGILRLRGGVKPGHFRGWPFLIFDSGERWPEMSAVETYAAVRRFVFVESKSRRELRCKQPETTVAALRWH